MPVVELMPVGVDRPKAWVSRSKSPSSAPGSTRARFAAGSTRTDRIADRSSINPPSQAALPAMLCPPPRTASSSSFSSRKVDGLHHVAGAGGTHDGRGAAVDHGVPQRARHVVAFVRRHQQAAAQRAAQGFELIVVDAGLAASGSLEFNHGTDLL